MTANVQGLPKPSLATASEGRPIEIDDFSGRAAQQIYIIKSGDPEASGQCTGAFGKLHVVWSCWF